MQWDPYWASVPSHPASLGHSLRVQLVQRAIHSHGDLQVLQPLVFPPLLHDSSQAGAAELGCPPGHSSAHLLHHNAVLTCAVQAELLQDPPDLEEGQSITVGKQSRTSGPASWALEPVPPGSQPPIPRCPRRREEKMIPAVAELEQNATEAGTQGSL